MEKEPNKTVVLHLVLKTLVTYLWETHALVLYNFKKIKIDLHAIANYGIVQKTESLCTYNCSHEALRYPPFIQATASLDLVQPLAPYSRVPQIQKSLINDLVRR